MSEFSRRGRTSAATLLFMIVVPAAVIIGVLWFIWVQKTRQEAQESSHASALRTFGLASPVRNALCARDAVKVMAHRKNARVVTESEFHQNVEGPERSAHDGITRRAISKYRVPGNVFEQALRTPRFLEKLILRLLVDQTMRKAVAGDLVAARGNVSHELRLSLGYPSEHEERGASFKVLEEPEQPVGVGDDPRLARSPTAALYARR